MKSRSTFAGIFRKRNKDQQYTTCNRRKTAKTFKFGLFSLHAKIRSFKCLLQLSYNLDFSKWAVKSVEEKELKAKKKSFRPNLAVLVNCAKQRKGFHNANIASR